MARGRIDRSPVDQIDRDRLPTADQETTLPTTITVNVATAAMAAVQRSVLECFFFIGEPSAEHNTTTPSIRSRRPQAQATVRRLQALPEDFQQPSCSLAWYCRD